MLLEGSVIPLARGRSIGADVADFVKIIGRSGVPSLVKVCIDRLY